MTNRANNDMMVVPFVIYGTLMKVLFKTYWEDELTVFQNIANITDTLWTEAQAFEGYQRDMLLKEIELFDEIAENYNCGELTGDEVQELVVRQLPLIEQSLYNEDYGKSNIVQFPVKGMPLSPRWRAYQDYLRYERVVGA